MKKFLIPIDFSDASRNAASYAVQLTKNLADAEIVFYHVYGNNPFATAATREENVRHKVSIEELERIKVDLGEGDNKAISCIAEEGSFIESINDYTLGHHVDLVIMGITGSSRITQVFMGTNTLNVIRNISCPVMIIPPEAKYTGLKKAVFTSDFKDVARTTPFIGLKKVLNIFNPSLEILNVDSEHYVELTEEFKIEREAMEEKLSKYNPEFSFLRAYDFLEGINDYVTTKGIDVIITVPRKHSFLSQLFKTSHTKKLAYHSTVPIIAIPGSIVFADL